MSDLKREITQKYNVLTSDGVALRGLFIIDKEVRFMSRKPFTSDWGLFWLVNMNPNPGKRALVHQTTCGLCWVASQQTNQKPAHAGFSQTCSMPFACAYCSAATNSCLIACTVSSLYWRGVASSVWGLHSACVVSGSGCASLQT